MALEELIVEWSKERPSWQREVMRRIAAGDALTDDQYDLLVENLMAAKEVPAGPFGLQQLPQPKADDMPVRLVSVSKAEHVNALESKDPLTFEPTGLTVVYGDNGSGKSGYARLLKRVTRARHQEDVLTDVFRDTSLAQPSAVLAVRIGQAEHSLDWPKSSLPELQRMLFYDAACGSDYISSESDFPYRPSALFVMDGLIEVCVAIRARIDSRILNNSLAANDLPPVAEEARPTAAGKFLGALSASTSIAALDALIAEFDTATETIDQLSAEEASLHGADTADARHQLNRRIEKIETLRKHLENVDTMLGASALSVLQQNYDQLMILEEAAATLAHSFESEPLPGVGGAAWKALWEAARRFSKEYGYPNESFPFVGEQCRCVLCHQPLDGEARNRLDRFESFVRNNVQVRQQEARKRYEDRLGVIRTFTVSSEVVESILKDLRTTNSEVVNHIGELLVRYEQLRRKAIDGAIYADGGIPLREQDAIMSRLVEAREATAAAAETLAQPDGAQVQLRAVRARRVNLELLQQLKKSRPAIVSEVERLKERDALDAAKSAAATTGITKKILELSEDSITDVVRDTFTRETDRLRLERVTISRTRADKGTLLHQPKLVGARQQVTLPRVFSEGEQTALGLAAFFTEAHLDSSHSAIILDDPVTSLDHVRRGLVASRLTALAETRQVIVFTHDVAFVGDLKREANGKAVSIAERSVTRSRGDERKPGACSTVHPWKAKDVAARLGELRTRIVEIKKSSANWDQNFYDNTVALWAGDLSETWERIFSQEIVGQVLAEGGLEVRPMMVKILARFSENDQMEFQGSYSRVSQWAKRHDKSALVNYVAPDVVDLEVELARVETWFKRVKGYRA